MSLYTQLERKIDLRMEVESHCKEMRERCQLNCRLNWIAGWWIVGWFMTSDLWRHELQSYAPLFLDFFVRLVYSRQPCLLSSKFFRNFFPVWPFLDWHLDRSGTQIQPEWFWEQDENTALSSFPIDSRKEESHILAALVPKLDRQPESNGINGTNSPERGRL